MSERAPKNNEHFEDLSNLDTRPEQVSKNAEHAEKLHKNEQDHADMLAEARKDIIETSKANKQPNPLDKLEQERKDSLKPRMGNINQDLKRLTLQRELTHIRRQLSAPKQTLSKVIHQPVVRVVSEVSGKTVSRPSGLLGGGILALIGTTGYLWLAKNQGFEYNSAVFLALFGAGFMLGLALEIIVWALLKPRQRAKYR